MVALTSTAGSFPAHAPHLRRISGADLKWALREGWRDFGAMRGDLLILGFAYPAVGLLASAVAADRSLVPLLFPMIAGLSILGPAVAAGFYELPRRRDAGDDPSWSHFFDPYLGRAATGILTLSLVLAALFTAWMGAAWGIYQLTLAPLGPHAPSEFVRDLFTTSQGWTLIVAGNMVGAVFAAVVLGISLVSFPLVVDGRARPLEAMVASVEACLANPRAAAGWGVTVAALLVLGSIPLFVGLAIVLPVLGYATWRLYTRLIEP